MRIGFYAPLKHPDHPIPSGDRRVARQFLAVFKSAGFAVDIMSSLRSWEGQGCVSAQRAIRRCARLEVARIMESYQHTRPDLIFVYHAYHKAPDWIGQEIACRLDIPYIIAEASFAPKQRCGKWQVGHDQVQKCIRSCAGIISLNLSDNHCIKPLLNQKPGQKPGQKSTHKPGQKQTILDIKPFMQDPSVAADSLSAQTPVNPQVARAEIARDLNINLDVPWIVTVAMMRHGDKLQSYKALSDSLARLAKPLEQNWAGILIGAGAASTQVKSLFNAAGNIRFTGELESAAIFKYLKASDLYVWPSINEAFGMALLEAVCAGLPSVVYDYGAVGSLVEDGVTGRVIARGESAEFTAAVQQLLADKALRQAMAKRAQEKYKRQHSINSAVQKIGGYLESILANR